MLTGKMFKLKRQILAVTLNNEPRKADFVPEGAIIEVLGGPRQDDKRLVDIRWENADYAVFFVDLEERGEEIRSAGA